MIASSAASSPFFFLKQKTAYEMIWSLEFRRVLFRSRDRRRSNARGRLIRIGGQHRHLRRVEVFQRRVGPIRGSRSASREATDRGKRGEHDEKAENGRAAGRGRGENSVVAVSLKKKKK